MTVRVLYDNEFLSFAQGTVGGVDGRIAAVFEHVNIAFDAVPYLETKFEVEVVDSVHISTVWSSPTSPWLIPGLE